MNNISKLVIVVSIITSLGYISACAHAQPTPDRAMNFDEGIKVLASNLADQLENSTISNKVNQLFINPITKQKDLNTITLDPFIDVESGYPVKVNDKIVAIVTQVLSQRFKLTGEMVPDNLETAKYIFNGMVTIEDKKKNIYKVYAAIFDKASGKVLASANVHILNFDTTPKDIYKDSPIFLKGQDYHKYVSSVKKMPDETVEAEYQDKLVIKSMQVKGDKLYDQHEYTKSLSYYNQASSSKNNQQLEVLNGQFTILVKQGQWKLADGVYSKLLRVSVNETHSITSKILFKPRSSVPLENNAELYKIYMKEIAELVATTQNCKIKIIGHCSRTGPESYNVRLSRDRALWIQKQMASYVPGILARSEVIGRGFHDNIVGNGRDDITDQIDRRVEFVFSQ
jgi:outer membrane protein OmpA-like peptidoglycan-associated protein